MKKFLLLIFSTLFIVFSLTGCADDKKEEIPTLSGTYDVDFFGSQVTKVRCEKEGCNEPSASTIIGMADLNYISNNCKLAEELYPTIVNQNRKNDCKESDKEEDNNQSKLLDGKVVIIKTDNSLNITSRIQMENGAIENLATDKYQFIEYYETSDITTFKGSGVKVYNYDINKKLPSNPTDFPKSTYELTELDNGSIKIIMTIVDKPAFDLLTVDTINTIILRKISNNVTPLENKIQKAFVKL